MYTVYSHPAADRPGKTIGMFHILSHLLNLLQDTVVLMYSTTSLFAFNVLLKHVEETVMHITANRLKLFAPFQRPLLAAFHRRARPSCGDPRW